MKVVLSNDKGGYRLKEAAVAVLRELGHEPVDLGSQSPDEPFTHTQAAKLVAETIQQGRAERGLLFCGTGMGVALAANKYKGIYAGVVESVFAARHCRLINDCNVLCMGAYIVGEYMAKEMVAQFVSTGFADGFVPERAANLRKQYEIIRQTEEQNFR